MDGVGWLERRGTAINMMQPGHSLTEGLGRREREKEVWGYLGVRQHVILRSPDWIELGASSKSISPASVQSRSNLRCAPPRCLCHSVVSGPPPNSRIRRSHYTSFFPLPRQTPLPSHHHPFVQQITIVQPTIQPNRFADQLMHPTTRPCSSPAKARNPGFQK